VLPAGVFVGTRLDDGKRVERHFKNREWVEKLPSEHKELLEAFTGEPTVLLDGDVAVVWAADSFHVDGQSSHTGVDAFNQVPSRSRSRPESRRGKPSEGVVLGNAELGERPRQ
jgi:hypothetical protein